MILGSGNAEGSPVMNGLDEPPTKRFWLVVIVLLVVGVGAFMYVRHEIDAAQLRKDCQQDYSSCPTR